MEDHQNNFLSVSHSILLAALIISGAMIYSVHLLLPNSASAGQAQKDAPVKVADRANAPTEGTGKVTIVEFSDFQCPFCKQFYTQTYNQIKTNYIDTGKVTFIYRHFPLSIHVNAEISAEAGECANKQGKFWPYFDLLFSKGQSDGRGLDSASLKSYAQTVGLDTNKFNSCLDGGETASVVKADFAEGQKAGVSGTPSFLINGKMIVGAQPYSVFEQAIEEALKK